MAVGDLADKGSCGVESSRVGFPAESFVEGFDEHRLARRYALYPRLESGASAQLGRCAYRGPDREELALRLLRHPVWLFPIDEGQLLRHHLAPKDMVSGLLIDVPILPALLAGEQFVPFCSWELIFGGM
jgi:hypothetical protein